MREFETRECEPLPRRQSVELIALRRHDENVAAQLRSSLPLVLAGIVGEVPGAELGLTMLTDPDGMVETAVAVSAGDESTAVITEVAAVLDPIAETAPCDEQNVRWVTRWPVVPDARRGPLGFVHQETSPAKTVRWFGDKAMSTQLADDLATLPGQGIEVVVRAVPHAPEPRWQAQLHVVTAGDKPSLRLRAAVRRQFAGLQVASSPADAGVWLEVGSTDLPALFAIPVAGPEAPLGAYTAAPAPIVVTPSRTGQVEDGLRIGQAVTNSGRQIPVQLSIQERLRHIHVLGRTGTGKSSALAGMVRELASGSDGALVADPHGQLCDRILAELPDEARDRVWVIRCGDVDNPVPMNPLAETDPVRRDIAINDVCATFQYLFDKNATGIVGPRFQERVGMTLRALAAVHGPRASLLDVPIAVTNDSFMNAAVKKAGDQRLQNWWATDKLERRSNEHGQVVAWVNSKFEAFSNTAAMRGILGSGADAIDFAEAMDNGRIILLDLSKAELGAEASRLLGYMYLSRVWHAALRRTRPERPFTVVIDEAHTLIAGALTNMLAEGRKFGLSVVLAHQYLEQLDTDLRPAVDGNVDTTIAFRCAVGDAGEIYKRFGGQIDPSVLVTLPELTAVSLRTAQTEPSQPHTVVIDHNRRVTPRPAEELDAHVAELMRTTWVDLVDPHRDATAAALRGASKVTASVAGRDSQTPRPRVPATPPPVPGRPKAPSFLDEWIRARTETTAQLGDRSTEQNVTEGSQQNA
ncbi:type IV secretory system conjugative DNA transfer family protein [Mycolicibacterium sp. jd]|uniref:type IV secretory system conjugative DNA transfer family protein n=1 Tax=unclassified Mycolicibacterium TaxID=2636767 RepID=UPI00351B9F22